MVNKINIHHLGEAIRTLRKQHGLTLKALSSQLGYTTHGYISEIETGKKTASMDFIVKFCELLELSIDQFLKGEIMVASTQKIKLLTTGEVERIRLILSTYQDGTGMLAHKEGLTLPGWRDFERAVALALGGEAQESKYIFDVLLPSAKENIKCGVSCKMRRELNRLDRDGRVTIEISNSAGKFWDYLNDQGINQSNYKQRPAEVGNALLNLVEQWYQSVS
ncbi:MAG: helix-turn-helix domain-containing protein, partial [Streptococcus sp.]|nr:helix-turn-helix domain-containing protein [Streptococcus sp.]